MVILMGHVWKFVYVCFQHFQIFMIYNYVNSWFWLHILWISMKFQKIVDSCWLMSFRIQVSAQGGPPQNPEDARREQAEGSIIDSALEKD